jgi:predicted phosphate transport protein (TIGR00153 family)
MFSINPKEDKFFDLFIEEAKNVHESAVILRKFMDDLKNKEERLKEIEEMEHKGDKKVHDILEQLNKSFITPIDREDIYAIAKEMDDIVDNIESTGNRFIMFNVNECTEQAKVMSDMIVAATKEIIDLMEELKVMRKSKKLKEKIIEINRIEDEGDTYYRKAVRELFNGEMSTLEVIKWREIYEFLEKTLDACEAVANIIEGIVMKHA